MTNDDVDKMFVYHQPRSFWTMECGLIGLPALSEQRLMCLWSSQSIQKPACLPGNTNIGGEHYVNKTEDIIFYD